MLLLAYLQYLIQFEYSLKTNLQILFYMCTHIRCLISIYYLLHVGGIFYVQNISVVSVSKIISH